MDFALARNYERLYRSRCLNFLKEIEELEDLGIHFGGQSYEREAQHLIENELAQTT